MEVSQSSVVGRRFHPVACSAFGRSLAKRHSNRDFARKVSPSSRIAPAKVDTDIGSCSHGVRPVADAKTRLCKYLAASQQV